uniref:Uncharacterized protein n=1 Tax=Arundo donax TaxID=35708 RepID=A0A0A9CB56_ARUDO
MSKAHMHTEHSFRGAQTCIFSLRHTQSCGEVGHPRSVSMTSNITRRSEFFL